MKSYSYQPLILIGAARSGTKLIRDLIAEHPSVDKVPYDINYVWRVGNDAMPHDELTPDLLTATIHHEILQHFETYSSGAPFLIEKTVSNCLRVPYVHAVFPDAQFIHLVRDGRDVVESARRQWNAPPNWRYILGKARTFPFTDAFGYALSYAKDAFRKLVTQNGSKASTWGPRYAGIEEDLANKTLLEVCAVQWARSVEKASTDLGRLPDEQVITVRYEDFVTDPRGYLERIARFIGLDPLPYAGNANLDVVSQQNVGKGIRNLSPEQLARIQPIIEDTLSMLGYTQTHPATRSSNATNTR